MDFREYMEKFLRPQQIFSMVLLTSTLVLTIGANVHWSGNGRPYMLLVLLVWAIKRIRLSVEPILVACLMAGCYLVIGLTAVAFKNNYVLILMPLVNVASEHFYPTVTTVDGRDVKWK